MITLKSFTTLKLFAFSLVTISILGTSCTSLQQSTAIASDDLYATPHATETVRNEERIQDTLSEQYAYQDYQNYQDDRYLRLKVANRDRWSSIDDYGYWNDPRYNNAYYPSYTGWNSWYTGYYGASWYDPFGASFAMGWGGYGPYMNSYYSLGWGFNDFAFGGGYGGYGGFGYGGFGYGGFGYGGWSPYYAGYWNPYSYYYPGYGGYAGYGGYFNNQRPHYQDPRAMQTSRAGLAAYRNTSGLNNTNTYVNSTNGTVRYTGNPDLNNRFGNLVRRVITSNTNVNQANSFDRPSRTFGNNFSSSNQYKTASTNTSSTTNTSAPVLNSNAGGRSGGYSSGGSSSSSGRAPRGQ
jgi:hypothetical protein